MDKRRLMPTDLYEFTPVGEPQISPNGSLVAFVRQFTDFPGNIIRTEIWMVSTAGGTPRPLTSGGKTDAMPRWSPDGAHLCFVSDRCGRNQLYLMDPAGGEARVIATEEEPKSPPEWSPDGKSIAFVAGVKMQPEAPFYPGAPEDTAVPSPKEKEEQNRPKVIKTIRHKQEGVGFFGDSFTHVFVVSAEPTMAGEKKPVRQVTAGRYNHAAPAWSPDGRYLAFAACREEPDADLNWLRHLWIRDLGTGDLRRVLADDYNVHSPVFSPDGASVAFLSTGCAMDWGATPSSLYTIEFRPERFPLSFSDATNLTSAIDREIGSTASSEVRYGGSARPICWTSDSRHIYTTVSTEGRGELWKIPRNPSESPQRVGSAARRAVAAPTVASDGRLAYTVGSSTVPDEVFTLGPDGKETRLTDLNGPVAGKFDCVEPERILCKGPDNWDIEGWMYRPLGYEPGKRYPTILSVHGGPSGMYGWGFHWQFQYLVGRGYAVVAMNPRGSEGYGGKFSAAVMGDFGGKEFHDLMAGVDYAITTGLADPNRLGITGGSHGGYMTCWAITQTQRFKAAVALAVITNEHSMYGTSDIGYSFTELGIKGQPWANPETLLEHSPLAHASNVTTPLLIMHGEVDYRCPIGQAEEMFTALKRQGKTAVLVRYPAEGHGFKQSHHVVDRWERTVAWFDHYLKRP